MTGTKFERLEFNHVFASNGGRNLDHHNFDQVADISAKHWAPISNMFEVEDCHNMLGKSFGVVISDILFGAKVVLK